MSTKKRCFAFIIAALMVVGSFTINADVVSSIGASEMKDVCGGECWDCPCGSCTDSSCYEAANGNGYTKKIGNDSEYAICQQGVAGGSDADLCETSEPAPCWTNKWGCDDSSCSTGCSWSPQEMATMCEFIWF